MFAKIRKLIAYILALGIILMALAVGLLRILLPQLPEYREEIRARLATEIKGEIDFDRIDARWRLRGPEILLHNVKIGERIGERSIEPLVVSTLSVGVSMTRLLFSRELEIRSIGVTDATISIARGADGLRLQNTLVQSQDMPSAEQPERNSRSVFANHFQIFLNDVRLSYTDLERARESVIVEIERASLDLDDVALQGKGALKVRHTESTDVDFLVTGNLTTRNIQGLLGGSWHISLDTNDLDIGTAKIFSPQTVLLPHAGSGDVTLDARLDGGRLRAASLTFDVRELVRESGSPPADVSGRAEWTRRDDGWVAAISDLLLVVDQRRSPRGSLQLSAQNTEQTRRYSFDVNELYLTELPYVISYLPPPIALRLRELGLGGALESVSGFVELERATTEQMQDFEINAVVRDFGVASQSNRPGFSGLTAEIHATPQGGRLQLDSVGFSADIPTLFSNPLQFDRAIGALIWRRNPRGVSILSDGIDLQSEGLSLTASLELLLPVDKSSPVIDLRANWSSQVLNKLGAYTPDKVMKEKLVAWLSEGLLAGELVNGSFQMAGALKDFPFAEGTGVFRGSFESRGAEISFSPKWPVLQSVNARVELDGMRLSSSENDGQTGGMKFSNAKISLADIRENQLKFSNSNVADLSALLGYIGQSPVRGFFGSQFENIDGKGAVTYNVSLAIPLNDLPSFELDGSYQFNDATIALSNFPYPVSKISGLLRVRRDGVYGQAIKGEFLSQPMLIDVAPDKESEAYPLRINASSTLTAATLTEQLGLPLAGRVEGDSAYQIEARLPRAGEPLPALISLQSSLEGLSLDLPYPVGKRDQVPMAATLAFALDSQISLTAALGETVRFAGLLERGADERVGIERGTIALGNVRPILSVSPGLFIDGRIDRLRLSDWLSLSLGDGSWFKDNLQSASLEVDDLYVVGQRIRAASASLTRTPASWLIDIQSPAVAGVISLPMDFAGAAPVVLEMERLKLLESDPLAEANQDPTSLPAMRVRAAQFALGAREFGALDATIEKVDGGLVVSPLSTTSDSFSLSGSASWLNDLMEESGSRTGMELTLTSGNVEKMMTSLGYAPGISANSMQATASVSFSGGPREEFIDQLDGEVSMQIGPGILVDVDPGAGRVVGLMSVAALPRRLALDFRDVFQKGFSFDEISGDFRIVNGEAYTCNLSLKGSVADVGMIGRASLHLRNYNQTAVVNANVGNTLPAVGAVVAGPQVGAVLLLFSQIFKKPLRGISQAYYQISGGWDEPSIERTEAERFVATGEMAGCIVDVPAQR